MAKKITRVLLPVTSSDIVLVAIEDVCSYLSTEFGMDMSDDETVKTATDLVAIVLMASGAPTEDEMEDL